MDIFFCDEIHLKEDYRIQKELESMKQSEIWSSNFKKIKYVMLYFIMVYKYIMNCVLGN